MVQVRDRGAEQVVTMVTNRPRGATDEPASAPLRPRSYRLGQRQAAVEQTRARIIAAARELLMAGSGFAGFSMDAVARQAGVARVTIYYQFGSKTGLLEALFDSLAARGGIAENLAAAFQQEEPLDALTGLIAAFGRFWGTNRPILRRLHGLAALDPELEQTLRARNERRRRGLRRIVGLLIERYGRPAPEALEETVDVLHTLIRFESFDNLAGPSRGFEEVTPLMIRAARAVLGLGQP